jgi:periplasmic divalent cation tolerance protein
LCKNCSIAIDIRVRELTIHESRRITMEPVQPVKAVVVLTTTPHRSGDAIAQALISEHLAACVNILETRSLFRWKGEMNREDEELLIIKTRTDKVGETVERICHLHTYELPEIIVLPLIGGYEPYLQWIGQETGE